jgi:hypothetical protein
VQPSNGIRNFNQWAGQWQSNPFSPRKRKNKAAKVVTESAALAEEPSVPEHMLTNSSNDTQTFGKLGARREQSLQSLSLCSTMRTGMEDMSGFKVDKAKPSPPRRDPTLNQPTGRDDDTMSQEAEV